MSIIIAHPTGNNNVRHLVQYFSEQGKLDSYHTTLAVSNRMRGSFINGIPGMKDVFRRALSPEVYARTYLYPVMEMPRLLAMKLKMHRLTKPVEGMFSVDKIYQHLDRKVAAYIRKHNNKGVRFVYGYEDGCRYSFQAARQKGFQCIYELPIAYWNCKRKLLLEEQDRLPHWAQTLGSTIAESAHKLARKEAELELADKIIVPSHFVADSLPNWVDSRKVIVSPFGTPRPLQPHGQGDEEQAGGKGPLRVLFVGSMGQRKGLADLFAAIRMLNTPAIELVVLGSLQAPMDFYRQQLPHFTYEPGRSNAEVLALMRSCDVFCLPSIVEGRALVLQEAMSQGLPLIITPNTGGADLVEEGRNGFVVPVRNPFAIADKLQWFLSNRQLIPAMGRAAQEIALKLSWRQYAQRIDSFMLQTNGSYQPY